MSFALFLFTLLLLTGIVWGLEGLALRRRRVAACQQELSRLESQLRHEPEEKRVRVLEQERARLLKQPWWVEYSVSFFPVILIVFLLRSFLVEPFKIPSSSMVPTLLVGDFILVNKYTYGIRLPVANRKLIELGSPGRGDVMVFRFPEDPSLDYIKRVVGIPGDRVEYRNKRLSINGAPVPTRQARLPGQSAAFSRPRRTIMASNMNRLDETRRASMFGARFPFAGNCNYIPRLGVHGAGGPLLVLETTGNSATAASGDSGPTNMSEGRSSYESISTRGGAAVVPLKKPGRK